MPKISDLIQPRLDRVKASSKKSDEQLHELIRDPLHATSRIIDVLISHQSIIARQTIVIEALLIEIDELENRIKEHRHRP